MLRAAGFALVADFVDDVTRDPHMLEKNFEKRLGKKAEYKVKFSDRRLWEHTLIR